MSIRTELSAEDSCQLFDYMRYHPASLKIFSLLETPQVNIDILKNLNPEILDLIGLSDREITIQTDEGLVLSSLAREKITQQRNRLENDIIIKDRNNGILSNDEYHLEQSEYLKLYDIKMAEKIAQKSDNPDDKIQNLLDLSRDCRQLNLVKEANRLIFEAEKIAHGIDNDKKYIKLNEIFREYIIYNQVERAKKVFLEFLEFIDKLLDNPEIEFSQLEQINSELEELLVYSFQLDLSKETENIINKLVTKYPYVTLANRKVYKNLDKLDKVHLLSIFERDKVFYFNGEKFLEIYLGLNLPQEAERIARGIYNKHNRVKIQTLIYDNYANFHQNQPLNAKKFTDIIHEQRIACSIFKNLSFKDIANLKLTGQAIYPFKYSKNTLEKKDLSNIRKNIQLLLSEKEKELPLDINGLLQGYLFIGDLDKAAQLINESPIGDLEINPKYLPCVLQQYFLNNNFERAKQLISKSERFMVKWNLDKYKCDFIEAYLDLDLPQEAERIARTIIDNCTRSWCLEKTYEKYEIIHQNQPKDAKKFTDVICIQPIAVAILENLSLKDIKNLKLTGREIYPINSPKDTLEERVLSYLIRETIQLSLDLSEKEKEFPLDLKNLLKGYLFTDDWNKALKIINEYHIEDIKMQQKYLSYLLDQCFFYNNFEKAAQLIDKYPNLQRGMVFVFGNLHLLFKFIERNQLTKVQEWIDTARNSDPERFAREVNNINLIQHQIFYKKCKNIATLGAFGLLAVASYFFATEILFKNENE